MSKMQITINGEKQDYIPAPLSSYLEKQNITSSTGGVAVAVNNNVIPRNQWVNFTPKADDEIEIITAVSGG